VKEVNYVQSIADTLRELNVGKVFENEPLANHTTWKVGGPADVLVIPQNKEALIRAVRALHERNVPWKAIGRGSNLLIRDGGIRGVVFKVSDVLDHLYFDGTLINVGAGYSFIKLAMMATRQGLTGLEFAGGIPGNVGGAVYMNAGAHGSDISRILKQAEVLLETGELATFSVTDLKYSYRTSHLQRSNAIVLEVQFQLEYGDRMQIAAALAKHKDHRRLTQPLQLPCAGSVFRNPPGDHAGRLVESAGLKGYRIGGAEVSTLHANFIVNVGQATAQDVLTLMEHVQHKVQEAHGVRLVPEVLVVGEG
jgi:UDP-N-acetylmuramate dehydrogenase